MKRTECAADVSSVKLQRLLFRRETAGALLRSGSSSSQAVLSPGFNENTSTGATVLINSIHLKCDLYRPSLWGGGNICSVNTVPNFVVYLIVPLLVFSPPPSLFQSKDIGVQMHEELVKVTNELYTVSCTSDRCTCLLPPES